MAVFRHLAQAVIALVIDDNLSRKRAVLMIVNLCDIIRDLSTTGVINTVKMSFSSTLSLPVQRFTIIIGSISHRYVLISQNKHVDPTHKTEEMCAFLAFLVGISNEHIAPPP